MFNTMKKYKSISVGSMITLVIYLCGCFVNMTFNIVMWSGMSRLSVAIFGGMVLVFGILGEVYSEE